MLDSPSGQESSLPAAGQAQYIGSIVGTKGQIENLARAFAANNSQSSPIYQRAKQLYHTVQDNFESWAQIALFEMRRGLLSPTQASFNAVLELTSAINTFASYLKEQNSLKPKPYPGAVPVSALVTDETQLALELNNRIDAMWENYAKLQQPQQEQIQKEMRDKMLMADFDSFAPEPPASPLPVPAPFTNINNLNF